MNILITSCGRDVTLIKSFKTALTNNGGGNVFASDTSFTAPALYFSDRYILTPKSDDPRFIPVILDFCEKNDVHLVITARDAELEVFAKERRRFEELNIRLLLADLDTIEICRDKGRFTRFCEKRGFSIPRTYWDFDSVVYPVFIKPLKGAGSNNIHKISSKQHLILLFDLYGPDFLVQEYVTWPEYSVDVFCDFEAQVISVVPRERIRTVGGETYIGKTLKNDLLISEAKALAEALRLIGPNTIQCFFNGFEVKFIEVNPRFGGGANLGFSSGANVPEFLIRIMNGEKIPPRIGEFRDNFLMLRYTCDLFFEDPSAGCTPAPRNTVNVTESVDKQIYCVDIDGTICTEGVAYELALPMRKTIEKINSLFEKGHKIILFTARGAYSGVDWTELTSDQLAQWGVKYHELHMGKPFAHWYIDNKAVHVFDWI